MGDEFKCNFARLHKEAANKNIYDPRHNLYPSYWLAVAVMFI